MAHPTRESRPLRFRALPWLALTCAIFITALSARPAREVAAGWWDDLDKGEQVTLSDLCAEPVRWRGKVVTFACIYNEPAEIYSPYFTSFNAENHWNVTSWLDGSPLWELDAFQRDDFPFLYLPRTHSQRNELFGLPRFTRIEITGKVKDVYRSRPWIEIQAFRVTAATLGNNVVAWMKEGDGYAAQSNYIRAEANYRLALGEIKLADVYRMRVEKRLAELLRAAGKDIDAKAVEGRGPVLGASGPPLPAGARLGFATPNVPTTSTEEPAPDAGLRPVAPPTPGSVRPPSELTDDLPGTPADAGPAAPSMPGPSGTPPISPRLSPPMPPLPYAPPASRAEAPAVGPSTGPATPVPAAAAPAAPSPSEIPPAPLTPPPPPPREPRLSGVR